MAETIPPCINLIILGFVADLSIGGLFMAGLAPAALMALALIGVAGAIVAGAIVTLGLLVIILPASGSVSPPPPKFPPSPRSTR